MYYSNKNLYYIIKINTPRKVKNIHYLHFQPFIYLISKNNNILPQICNNILCRIKL